MCSYEKVTTWRVTYGLVMLIALVEIRFSRHVVVRSISWNRSLKEQRAHHIINGHYKKFDLL
jgi:hypothetical protein